MIFLSVWIVSTAVVFFLLYIVFNLDEKYLLGDVRDLVEEIWVSYILVTFIPLLNIVLCLITIVVFIVMLIADKYDNSDMNGEKVLKKIFFIKEDKK